MSVQGQTEEGNENPLEGLFGGLLAPGTPSFIFIGALLLQVYFCSSDEFFITDT